MKWRPEFCLSILLLWAVAVEPLPTNSCSSPCSCDGATMNCSTRHILIFKMLKDLPHITTLDLSSNFIEGISSDSFSHVFCANTLILSCNSVSAIDKTAFQSVLQLSSLNLSNNKLSSIHLQTFVNNADLRALLLNNNRLSNVDFLKHIKKCNINYLNLDHNRIREISEGIFNRCRNITHIVLSYNHIESLDSTFLHDLQSLLYFNLSNNFISHLPNDAFAQLTRVEVLDLSYNKLLHIPDYLFANCASVDRLLLSHNKIASIGPSAFGATLHTDSDSVGDASACAGNAFSGSRATLSHLDLSYNQLQNLDVSVLASLREHSHLNLEHNKLKHLVGNNLECFITRMMLSVNLEGNVQLPTAKRTSDMETTESSILQLEATESAGLQSKIQVFAVCGIAVFLAVGGALATVKFFRLNRVRREMVQELKELEKIIGRNV